MELLVHSSLSSSLLCCAAIPSRTLCVRAHHVLGRVGWFLTNVSALAQVIGFKGCVCACTPHIDMLLQPSLFKRAKMHRGAERNVCRNFGFCRCILTDKYLGIVMEYASGGNLFDHVSQA